MNSILFPRRRHFASATFKRNSSAISINSGAYKLEVASIASRQEIISNIGFFVVLSILLFIGV